MKIFFLNLFKNKYNTKKTITMNCSNCSNTITKVSKRYRGNNCLCDNCRKFKNYEVIELIGKGTFGSVFKVRDKKNKENIYYAMKHIVINPSHRTREIAMLTFLNHPNIISSKDNFIINNSQYIILEYMTCSLYDLIKNYYLDIMLKKYYIKQLLEGLKEMHSHNIAHRDLKPENILINEEKQILKIGDLGAAKQINSDEKNTAYICSRYYRAPECLFGSRYYTISMDMWSFGCIVYELITKKVLFNGNNTKDHIDKVIKIRGIPTEEECKYMKVEKVIIVSDVEETDTFQKNISRLDKNLVDFLSKCLDYNPEKRMSAEEALNHSWLSLE